LKIAIKHIANIQTGVFAKPVAHGDVVYLQPKYYNKNGVLSTILIPDLKGKAINEKHLLREGDVIFSAKGSRNFAATIKNETLPAAASTSFFVVRIHSQKILPEFLTLFLNLPNTLRLLKAKARGTSMVSIAKSVIADLEIAVPGIQKQKLILKIHNLRNLEIQLKQQIDTLREKQFQKQIFNALK
jgi:restriction endonuclease S subunit